MGENVGFRIRLNNGDILIGDVTIYPQRNLPFKGGDELRISSFSMASDRCPPLIVLHTITSEGVSFKLEPLENYDESSDLVMMHSACLRELKTAIIYVVGGMEIHLVAVNANKKQIPCFWGFIIAPGLYKSCLSMLNLRCLALVFDLDETLIVANTMRSFEDRIDALGSKLKGDSESQKALIMSSELKRYMQDRAMLKQYIEEDRVWDNVAEKFVTAQMEVVASSVMGGVPLKRPVVRLDDRNMIFTRINPNIRDTSVLVRLRPAWDELRSYLTAKGRKRFEVFVCTMAEREYALEMWRLLDPDAELISTNEMNDRVVCVKSGLKKSLNNVFSGGSCHSKMAMVIDDRLKVWEDQDQPQVHVVPAFAPYYAPQAETSTPVPILCVARNVACHVRAGFFRDLDEVLSKKMADVDFDAEIPTLPPPPIVSSYMIVEEETGIAVEAANENKEFPDGMTDVEVGKRLAEGIGSGSTVLSSIPAESDRWKSMMLPPPTHLVSSVVPPHIFPPPQQRPQSSFIDSQLSERHGPPRVSSEVFTMIRPPLMPTSNLSEQSHQASPLREEGEVPESELDPDTRRRLLILQHGQDTQYQHTFQEAATVPVTSHLHVTIPTPTPAGGWLGAEEEMSPGEVSRTSSGLILEPESPSFRKQSSHSPPFYGSFEPMGADALPLVYPRDEKQRADTSVFRDHVYTESDSSSVLNQRDLQMKQNAGVSTSNPVAVLQEIAQKCNTKLEFRSIVNTTKELQFSVEVLFGGDKVGEGIGWTKKEAQLKAADNTLRFMASKFISHPGQAINTLGPGRVPIQVMSPYSSDESVAGWNARDTRFVPGLDHHILNEEAPQPPIASVSEHANYLDIWRFPEENRVQNPVAALKDYCTLEGVNVIFRDPSSGFLAPDQGYTCQVEVAGRVMGQGNGRSWEEAKQKAADEAMRSLMVASQAWGPSKRTNPPRSPPLQSNKRMRSGEPPRALQRMPPSPRQLSPRRF